MAKPSNTSAGDLVGRQEVDLALCPQRIRLRNHWRVDGTCTCQPSFEDVAAGAQLPTPPAADTTQDESNDPMQLNLLDC